METSRWGRGGFLDPPSCPLAYLTVLVPIIWAFTGYSEPTHRLRQKGLRMRLQAGHQASQRSGPVCLLSSLSLQNDCIPPLCDPQEVNWTARRPAKGLTKILLQLPGGAFSGLIQAGRPPSLTPSTLLQNYPN